MIRSYVVQYGGLTLSIDQLYRIHAQQIGIMTSRLFALLPFSCLSRSQPTTKKSRHTPLENGGWGLVLWRRWEGFCFGNQIL
jgi:hypothetical protein